MAKVLLEKCIKNDFPAGTVAVNQLDLEINDREFLVLIGPSGCGKSTTLRLIAGLETSTSGEVKIGERVVTHMQTQGSQHRNGISELCLVSRNDGLREHQVRAEFTQIA